MVNQFINSDLMERAGMEATEGRDGPQSPARLGVTLSVRRNLILSVFMFPFIPWSPSLPGHPVSETECLIIFKLLVTFSLINIFLGFS